MHKITEQLKLTRIIPVVVLNDTANAKPLAKALCDGGLPCAEITFRAEGAAECIQIMSQEYPEMLIGAGTVLTSAQADQAMKAGASFIVSPGLNPTVVKHCIKKKYPIIPGINNPTGIETALSMGLTLVKFFPAEVSGGLEMIKALSAPYPQIQFMPTGGINLENLHTYLACDKVTACGGSWMVKDDLIKAGNFEEIQRLTQEAVRTVRA
ncbi:MAG: bifunctional 4-hydroxy-2-oxoglutarate aldolase/2-dehydro-3-deoxy-phosphogluconate aldolase [Lachnospiraceae bacterium]|nr:bifunctional 4-hydroxy-2-oxoglutarate aldolase/2-dehydro-3-deoxy-phosphogluconate aldolase [Lachnospiraceae bacterium]